ncbi:MAG: DUF1648 domain-containing protein [Bacteroidetes bacterium]|nr:MAG: DUF1648 domain-containing protein [Bacteroidota bacterium]
MRITEFLKREWLPLLLLVLPFAALAFLWDQFPEQIPMHFNALGEVDRYGKKGFELFLLPLTSVFVYALLTGIVAIDPKKPQISPGAMHAMKSGVLLFLNTLFAYITWLQLNANPAFASKGIYAITALFFLFLGNYMGKMRPSYFMGIRTPWTLSSDENWTRTHRLGGRVWVIGSVFMLLLIPFVPEIPLLVVFLTYVLVLVAVPIAYSGYLYFRQKPGEAE